MKLKFMNAKELNNRIKSLFRKECDLLHEVLITIQEFSRRRLHEEFGYTSLYSYLTQQVGYSEGTAYRHIQAAKLLEDVPEIASKIQTGEISLAQMSLVQKAVKAANEKSETKVSSAQKAEILEQIANKPVFASEKLVAQILNIPVVKSNHIKPQADDSVLATLSIPKDLFDKIEQAQSLVSHSLESKDLVKFLEYAADLIIKQKTSVRAFKSKGPVMQKYTVQKPLSKASANASSNKTSAGPSEKEVLINDNASQQNRHVAVKKQNSISTKPKPFTPRQRKIILERDKCCQHREPKTKNQCESSWHLQVDHIIPLWAGGESTAENAQTLCGAHNRRKYRKQVGLSY